MVMENGLLLDSLSQKAANVKPCVVWLTGLSGAGKTSVANSLKLKLQEEFSVQSCILDGDDIRSGLCSDLGFSDDDRKENIRRIAEVAKIFFLQDIFTIVACISPFEADRLAARRKFNCGEFIEVFVDTPLHVCESRDTKGLYRKARENSVSNFTGIGSRYQEPSKADVHLHNSQQTIEQSVKQILDYLFKHDYLTSSNN